MKKNFPRVFKTCLIATIALLVTSCFFSTKAIYFDKEILVAEGATARLHELHNQQNFNAVFELLENKGQIVRDDALRGIKASYDTMGRHLESRLVEKKAFHSPVPGYTSQVKLAFESRFEKGNWMELFAWNIKNSSEAVLVEYRMEPLPAPSPGTPK